MMSLVSVLGCGTWFFLIEEQLYWHQKLCARGDRDGVLLRVVLGDLPHPAAPGRSAAGEDAQFPYVS